ncbi:NTP transferase domain-containing protein [Paenibacillus sepulcri]
MSEQIWALILAAGASRRMGEPKLLLPAVEGSLLKQAVLRARAAGNCRIAVIAAKHGPVKREHAGDLPVEWLETDRSHLGLGASLAAGLGILAAKHAPKGLIVLLADQPDMKSDMIRRVGEVYRENGGLIVQARYVNRPAHPVLFDASLFPELLALNEDIGAKSLLRKYKEQVVYVDTPEDAPRDIDTPEEYRHYLRTAGLQP